MKNFLVILFLIVVIALLNTLIGGAAGQALASLFVAIVLFIGKGDFLKSFAKAATNKSAFIEMLAFETKQLLTHIIAKG